MTAWQYFMSQAVDLHVEDRIDAASAQRQRRTAIEILNRLTDQPGIVLADEVGMGKTFVALAVACSVALQRDGEVAVVVMVPPSLKEKWPRDFDVFRQRCLRSPAREDLRAPRWAVENGVDLLKLLDDPPERRNHIIFATHGALSRGLTDKWVKLALIRRALSYGRLPEVRRAFPRFAANLLRDRFLETATVERLFDTAPAKWRTVLEEAGHKLADDPVPDALIDGYLKPEDLAGVFSALEQVPLRSSKSIEQRLLTARRALNDAIRDVWHLWLRSACKRVELPLLILDEAHHLKNPSTRLAKLFVEGDADAQLMGGPLAGVFQRMMFLTATPFQLGHYELMRVLERFQNISWTTSTPTGGRAVFDERLRSLRQRLDEGQRCAAGLEQAWARLRPEHLGAFSPGQVDAWWSALEKGEAPTNDRVKDVRTRFSETREAMRAAESELRPWVLRHLKPRQLPDCDVARRRILDGAQLRDEGAQGGLEITGDAMLPFLLAARAQAMVAASKGRTRALFAEGLASSFEAFRDTRNGVDSRDEDVPGGEVAAPRGDLAWYLDWIDRALHREEEKIALQHPKLSATVDRALDLWARGEKVLIFCFYRATGRALERNISGRLDAAINRFAAERTGVSEEEAASRLARIGDRLNDDGPLRREADELLMGLLRGVGELDGVTEGQVVDVMRRFLRTPSFLARFYPVDDGPNPIARALAAKDASGIRLDDKLRAFCSMLTNRATEDERGRYLEALDRIQTGERYGRDDDTHGKVRLLPNVRLANGETAQDTRQRLLLSFNTPFFPEVLVASSVLAEGVDLHLHCRHIIHHDLCWNPSTLEQRTGRVDRLGAKAERAQQSIQVFLPYVAATQDEKMFRVVRDRERWFQVVMGEEYAVDEATTDALAARVPLPEAAARELALRLDCR